jgi:thymidylate synthase (FAD)
MNVKLVNYSRDPSSNRNLLEQIAYVARVSNPSNQDNSATAEKLVRYLIKHQHWSPLEMVSLCLEINTTRDIARQILRHRSFSFQEFSQRYADPTESMSFDIREARHQDTKNRQNSVEIDITSPEERELQDIWIDKQQQLVRMSREIYTWAIQHGIAKEQARAVLPEGNTHSRMYMNGTLRSWVHYVQLRSGNGTQKEHRQVALACAEAIAPVFPMINEFISE